jgi:hypothetical protein
MAAVAVRRLSWLLSGQPFPLIISEPYETHGSEACTQRFAYPVLSS